MHLAARKKYVILITYVWYSGVNRMAISSDAIKQEQEKIRTEVQHILAEAAKSKKHDPELISRGKELLSKISDKVLVKQLIDALHIGDSVKHTKENAKSKKPK